MTSQVPANLRYSTALQSLPESEPVAIYNPQTLPCPAGIPPVVTFTLRGRRKTWPTFLISTLLCEEIKSHGLI